MQIKEKQTAGLCSSVCSTSGDVFVFWEGKLTHFGTMVESGDRNRGGPQMQELMQNSNEPITPGIGTGIMELLSAGRPNPRACMTATQSYDGHGLSCQI